MNWTADEIRNLRYRLGWSRAELAMRMKLEMETISAWECGKNLPGDEERNALLLIFQQAETLAERVQRRPIAEALMRDRGLSQIHDLDVIVPKRISDADAY